MVFGLILGAASIPLAGGGVVTPTVTGIGKGVGSASGDREKDEERGKNCKLKIFCDNGTKEAKEVHGRVVGLRDEKVSMILVGVDGPQALGARSESTCCAFVNLEKE